MQNHINLSDTLSLSKDRIRIPDVWAMLSLSGTPSRSCKTPWREDRHPSLSVFDEGKAFKDFATDEGGDVVTFISLATGMDFKDSANWLREKAGIPTAGEELDFDTRIALKVKPYQKRAEEPREPLSLPPLLDATPERIETTADSRNIHPQAVEDAIWMECLQFGEVFGFECWILTDDSKRCAEARRINGKQFPAIGSLGARKAHTLKGSIKSWPLGISRAFDKIPEEMGLVIVEGGPDFLAFLHFRYLSQLSGSERGLGFSPIAMLGRSQSIDTDAIEHFKGRRVRIYPHNDQDGGGLTKAQQWAQAIHEAGASEIDLFTFEGIRMRDGSSASDLNDCTTCHPEDLMRLSNILPTSTKK